MPSGRPSTCSSCVRSGRIADRVAAGRSAGAADRQPADLLRRRDVAIQQRRREIADRHVVEAVAGLVGRQQRRRRRRRAPADRGSAFWYSVRVSRRNVSVRPGIRVRRRPRGRATSPATRSPRRRSPRPAAACRPAASAARAACGRPSPTPPGAGRRRAPATASSASPPALQAVVMAGHAVAVDDARDARRMERLGQMAAGLPAQT